MQIAPRQCWNDGKKQQIMSIICIAGSFSDFWKQIILCENEADIMYQEKGHLKSISFVQLVKKSLACSFVCFLMMM